MTPNKIEIRRIENGFIVTAYRGPLLQFHPATGMESSKFEQVEFPPIEWVVADSPDGMHNRNRVIKIVLCLLDDSPIPKETA